MKRLLAAAALIIFLAGTAQATNVTRDANGWTDVAPSGDSVVIYVSSSGNDTNPGLTTGAPKLTIAAATAAAFAVDVKPSHVRLKCGDVWTAQSLGGYHNINGRGADEPIVFESWDFTSGGTACATRPQLKTSASSIGSFFSRGGSGTMVHVYFIGIDFYDAAKDPALGGSTTAANTNGIQIFDGGDDVLIENCAFRFLFDGIDAEYVSGPSPKNITVRRNLFVDMYNGGTNSGHAQGIYWGGVVGANVVEENIFDHNGWNVAGSQPADVFNHHTYIADSSGVTYRHNTLLTDSSLSTKFVFYGTEPTAVPLMSGITIYDNFYWEGEVGISMAADSGATCYATTGCITGASVTQNVLNQVDKANPTGRGLGWGIEVKTIVSSTISNNICSDFSATSNDFCIGLDDDLTTSISGTDTFANNLMYKIATTGLTFQPNSHWSGITVSGNAIQDPSIGSYMVQLVGATPYAGLTFSGGVYSPTATSHFASVGSTLSYTSWLSGSSETGSAINTVSYPAPTRSIDTYAASLGLTNAAGFEAAARTFSRANYHPEYLPPTLTDYFRVGFGLPTIVTSAAAIGRAYLFMVGGGI